MHHLIYFITTVIMGFFAIMNPIGNTPVFLGITQDFDNATTKKIAYRAVVTCFIIVTIFALLGKIIFKLFGITLPAFQIAGGILLFLVGYQLLQGKKSSVHHVSPDEGPNAQKANDIAVSPLAIPILAGPGTLSVAMNFVSTGDDWLYTAIVILVLAFNCLMVYLCFVSGEKIISKVNPGIIKVVTRIMGLIIAVIAVQMVMTGITHGFKL